MLKNPFPIFPQNFPQRNHRLVFSFAPRSLLIDAVRTFEVKTFSFEFAFCSFCCFPVLLITCQYGSFWCLLGLVLILGTFSLLIQSFAIWFTFSWYSQILIDVFIFWDSWWAALKGPAYCQHGLGDVNKIMIYHACRWHISRRRISSLFPWKFFFPSSQNFPRVCDVSCWMRLKEAKSLNFLLYPIWLGLTGTLAKAIKLAKNVFHWISLALIYTGCLIS